jgi:molecular chaperone Hsp33
VQGNIRGVAIQATELVQYMAGLHKLEGRGAQGLGEAVLGALLLASYCKPGERINLNIQGSRYYKQALVDGYPDGTVRGYLIENALANVKIGAEDEGPWGQGLLSVLRTKDTEGAAPYIGTVPLVTGHLAKDLSFYWTQSEQVPSAVGLVVEMASDGSVQTAGGFLIQAMPGATSDEIAKIEQHISELSSLAQEFTQNKSPLHLLSSVFQSTAFAIVEERQLKFNCTCSLQRVERALALVGVAELQEMLAKDNKATVRCDFCTKEYTLNAEDINRLIKSIHT